MFTYIEVLNNRVLYGKFCVLCTYTGNTCLWSMMLPIGNTTQIRNQITEIPLDNQVTEGRMVEGRSESNYQ